MNIANYMKNIFLLIIAGAAALIMAGCSTTDTQNSAATPPVSVAPPVDNAQKQKLYNYLLDEQGIDIIKVGETITVVISSDQLFIKNSANLDERYVRNLKIIAQLIDSYDTTNVAVNAYSDQSGDLGRALTEKQAQKILIYMKKHGVDTRLIYAKGYGNLYPVTMDGVNNHFNRRIEIKFQFYQN